MSRTEATCASCNEPIEHWLDGWIVAVGTVVHLACIQNGESHTIAFGAQNKAIPDNHQRKDDDDPQPNEAPGI